jgi:hypothetical protein
MHRTRPGSTDALVESASRLVCRCSEIEKSKYDEARTKNRHEGRLATRHSSSKVMRVVFFVGMIYLVQTLLDLTYCSYSQ